MSLSRVENFRRMMRREDPQWMPLQIGATLPVIDEMERRRGTRDVVEAFDLDFDVTGPHIAMDSAQWREALISIGYDVPADAEVGAYGITHAVPSRESVGAAYHFREMLQPLAGVTSVAQLEQLPWPDVHDPRCHEHLPAFIEHCRKVNRVAMGSCACTIFEHSWYLRGMDVLFEDMIEGNEIGVWLLDWFTERSRAVVGAYARAGLDAVLLGDDVGTQRGMMMSVGMWREHLKPRLASVVQAIRDNQPHDITVNYHSDGDVRDIVDDLVEIGIDSLNPVQPECVPVDEIIPAHKHHLAFWGMIGTQTTMPFGTPADVRREVERIAEHARNGAAVVVAPTHVLEPEVPWENIDTLIETVRSIRM